MPITVEFTCPTCSTECTKTINPARPLPIYCSVKCQQNRERRTVDREKVWRKYAFTDEMNTVLTHTYRTGKKGSIKKLWEKDIRFNDIPYPIIKRQLRVLGLVRSEVGNGWTVEEEEVVKKFATLRYSPEAFQRNMRKLGYHRSWGGIRAKLWKLEWDTRQGEWTVNDVATALGVDDHVVKRWVNDGHLVGRSPDGSPITYISTTALRRFFANEPFLVGTGAPDVPWIIYIMSDRWPTVGEVN